MIPSPGPNARPDGTRICITALPSSTLKTNRPLRSLSPSTAAPAPASSASSGVGSGQGSGSGSPTSIGMPDQNGERHARAAGSSHTRMSQSAAAARSASVCTRSGNSAASKRGVPPFAAHAVRYSGRRRM